MKTQNRYSVPSQDVVRDNETGETMSWDDYQNLPETQAAQQTAQQFINPAPPNQSNFIQIHDGMGIDPRMYAKSATDQMSSFIYNQQAVGTVPRTMAKFKDADRSMIQQQMEGGSLLDDDLPEGPGFSYFNHLFRRNGGKKKDSENKRKKATKGSNIYTEAGEALKVAIKALGINTSMNPSGLPIDIQDAQRVWFGEDDVDDNKVNQWRTSVEMGDARIDPKKVRKFTNYDGSLTWEVLNDDKTVSSRFTLGEYAGTKVFAQGGYNKFIEMLEKVKEQVGYDDKSGFDAVRGKY